MPVNKVPNHPPFDPLPSREGKILSVDFGERTFKRISSA
jgi:hypothetical protein